MQRPSIAARRFYQAFYRWNHPRPHQCDCTPQFPRRAAQCEFHQTRRLRNGEEGAATVPPRASAWKNNGAGKENGNSPVRDRQPATEASVDSIVSRWLAAPVEFFDKQPSDTLRPWGQAIRYRSDMGIMVTTAVPVDAISELSNIYGTKLEGLNARFGANVEIGSQAMHEGVQLAIISISGMHQEAAAAWKELGRFKAKYPGIISPTDLDGYARDDPTKPGEQIGSMGTRQSGSVATPISDGRPSSPPDVAEKMISPSGWERDGVKSVAERPTDSIPPWDMVLRHRGFRGCEVELVVSSVDWDKITQILSTAELEHRANVEITVGSPLEHSSTPPVIVRPLTLVGSAGRIQKLHSLLQTEMPYATQEALSRDSAGGTDSVIRTGPPITTLNGAYELSIPIYPDNFAQHWKVDCLREKVLEQSGCTKVETSLPREVKSQRNGLKSPASVIIEGSKENVEAAAEMIHDALHVWTPLRTRQLRLKLPDTIDIGRRDLLIRVIGGSKFRLIITLRRECLCDIFIVPKFGEIVLRGPEERVAYARKRLQAIVNNTLENFGVSPQMLLTTEDKIVEEIEEELKVRRTETDNIEASEASDHERGSKGNLLGTTLYLKIPPHPDPLQSFATSIVGKDSGRLAELAKQCSCTIKHLPEHSLLWVHGLPRNVTKAHSLLQRLLLHACQADGVQEQLTLTEEAPPERYENSIELQIPEHPLVPRYLALLNGKDRRTLAKIEESYDCAIDLSSNTMRLTGTLRSVRKVHGILQEFLDTVCARDGMRVPLRLEVVAVTGEPTKHFLQSGSKEIEAAAEDRGDVAENMKSALRPLTHPVVLVMARMMDKTTVYDRDTELDLCRGVTISSFNTVTLFPRPIISFNLKVPSRTWDAIKSSKWLCAHILPATPAGAAVAHAFTQPYESPSEPFRLLKRSGIVVQVGPPERNPAPKIVKGVDVTRIKAKLLEEKCVHVADHVVVVAEVSSAKFHGGQEGVSEEESTGLAYAMRGYRSMGMEIEPAKLEELSVESAEVADNPGSVFDSGKEQAGGMILSSEERSVDALDDPSQNAADDDEVDLFEAFQNVPMEADDAEMHEGTPEAQVKRRTIIDEEDDYDLEFDDDELENSTPTPSISQHSSSHSGQNPMASNIEAIPGAPSTLSGDPTSRRPKQEAANAWGISSPRLKSSYSTMARSRDTPLQLHARSFSTSSIWGQNAEDETTQMSVESSIPEPESLVTDPALLRSTVGDFLGKSDEFAPPQRIRALLRLKKDAHDASLRLEQALADGTLTEEESARLEKLITRNERRVAKTLALRSAEDLRRMLDKGRVDVRRAQWLESSIEKGQAVVMDEARHLRGMLDDGAIDAARFAVVKESLENQHRVLSTETMRLRQMVDEEGDEGGEASVANEKAKDFDGFKGNV